MRKGFITICLLLTMVLSAVAARTGKMPILGNECKYDTVLYRTVAPGVTLLQARFDEIRSGSSTYDMLVHLLEIDMTNQYNKFSPKLSCNGYYEWTSILMELQSEQRAGKKAVAAISGYSFTESGSGSGTTKVAEVRGPLISDGVVYHQDRGSILQYYYGADRMAYVGYAQLSGSVTVGGESWTIGQVNRFRDKVDGYGEISLFCNGIEKSQVSSAHRASGADVKVKLLNSRKQIIAGEDIECEVVAVMNGGGNGFNDGEAMLSADGAMAEKLKSLSVGQKVTIAVNTVDGSGNKLDVEHLAPVFLEYAVHNGVANQTTYNTNTATVILGVSADNTKTYIAVMDQNRSHATYRCFAEFMANVGAYDAMYMDGGPSTDMAVDDRVISDNLCSSDGGRAVGSCFMLYSTAPDDANIVRIEVDDDSERVMHVGDELKIMAWGYNQYDEMVRADIAATDEVTVTCTNNLGYWYNKKFVASQEGEGEIILTTKSGYTKRIPLAVEGRVDLQISPARIFTGEGRAVQAKLWYTERGNAKEVDPAEAVWSTYNDNVLKSVTGGLIEPWVLGGGTNRATVSAQYKGITAEADVTVEDLDEAADHIDLMSHVIRETKVNYQLPSVPTSFEMDVETTPSTPVTLTYSTAFDNHSVTATSSASGKASHSATATSNTTGIAHFAVQLDYNNAATYPVTVKEITSPADAKITSFTAYYGGATGISPAVVNGTVGNGANATYTLIGQRIANGVNYHGIVIQNGKKIIR